MTYTTVADVVRDLERNPAAGAANLYHPIPFPEFDHLTTSIPRAETQSKRDRIEAALQLLHPSGFAGLRFLDVGANGGFYTFHFAAKGARVTAYEIHPRYGPIGAFLARKKAPQVEWNNLPFDSGRLEDRRYDVALMLSVFQWITEGDKRLQEGKELLRAVSRHSDALVFELGFNSGNSAITTKERNHVRALYRLLRDNTDYTHHAYLGETRAWKEARHLFLSTKAPPPDFPGQWRKHWPPL